MVGKITAAERTAFTELLYLDAVRGWDSTGVFNAKPDGSTMMFKQASVPTEFLQRTQAKKVISEAGVFSLVGHNRAATKGLVNDDNAHPFQHDAVIGVHNGTLRTTHQLPNSAKFVVDSDNLYYAMSQEGIDTLIPKVNGAYALVWHDAREAGAVYVLRNSERPLWYAHSKDKATCFIASEYPMIGLATDNTRAKIELAADPKGYKYFNFKTMTLYRIGSDAVVEEVRALTEYTPPVTTYSGYTGAGDYGDNAYYRQGCRQTKEKALLDASGLKERQRVLCKFDQFELYNANVQSTGKLHGTTLTEGVKVVCFGHDYKDAMAISKDGYFEAVVTGVGLWQNDNADVRDPKTITVSVKDARSCGDTMVTAVLIENGKVIEEDIFFVKAIPTEPAGKTGAYWIASDTLKVGDTYPPKSNVLALVV